MTSIATVIGWTWIKYVTRRTNAKVHFVIWNSRLSGLMVCLWSPCRGLILPVMGPSTLRSGLCMSKDVVSLLASGFWIGHCGSLAPPLRWPPWLFEPMWTPSLNPLWVLQQPLGPGCSHSHLSILAHAIFDYDPQTNLGFMTSFSFEARLVVTDLTSWFFTSTILIMNVML